MTAQAVRVEIGGREVVVATTRRNRGVLADLPRLSRTERGWGQPIRVEPTTDDPVELVRLLNRVAADPRPDRVAIHGGLVVVAGSALLVAGPSYAGKSTVIAMAAAVHGAAYGGDELVHLLVKDGRVAPYLKPVSLKPGSWPVVAGYFDEHRGWRDEATWLVPGRALGGGLVRSPVRPVAIVFPERGAGRPTEVERLPASETALRLARHATNLHETERAGFSALCALARGTPGVVVRFGDASEALMSVLVALEAGGEAAPVRVSR